MWTILQLIFSLAAIISYLSCTFFKTNNAILHLISNFQKMNNPQFDITYVTVCINYYQLYATVSKHEAICEINFWQNDIKNSTTFT